MKPPLPELLHLPALTLAAHAYESGRANGIMTDRTAERWYDQLHQHYIQVPSPDLELINGIVTRSMIIDYAVLAFLARYKATVVDLGCGFSTRYHRLRPKIKSWNHLDLLEVMQVRDAFQKLGRSEIAIACDLTTATQATIPADFNQLFILEGVLNHLSREHAEALLRLLHESFRGSNVIGTVITQNGLKGAQSLALDLGLSKLMWAVEDLDELSEILGHKPHRVWLLGKVASRIGLLRPMTGDEASGLVFMVSL